jgi:hypothetical protein
MRKIAAGLIGMLACLMVSPILMAQEDAKPVILLYHGPKVGEQDLRDLGEALADAIEADSRMAGKAEIVLVGDQDLMNTLLYFPQVKCVVMALTTWELSASRIVPSTLWYFNEGGGIVGIGNAGHGDVTKTLNGSVFPLFANQYEQVQPVFYCQNKDTGEMRMIPPGSPPRCEATENRVLVRATFYNKATDHEVASGVDAEFSMAAARYVIHKNTSQTPPEYVFMKPEKGTYTKVYEDAQLGAPLVIVYEENGTSVTFAAGDQVSVREEDDTYFGTYVNDPNFRKLLQNAVHYVWNKETKYENAMARASEEFAKMEQEKKDLEQRVEDSQKSESTSKLLRSVLLIVVGIGLIVAIAYWAFVIPARQGGEGEPAAPAEES